MNKEINTVGGKVLVVEVPEEYLQYKKYIRARFLITLRISFIDEEGLLDSWDISEIDENFVNNHKVYILGKLSELTDKDCEEFVEIAGGKLNNTCLQYRDYMSSEDSYNYYDNSKGSLISLLQSEGIDVSKEWLIIKVL